MTSLPCEMALFLFILLLICSDINTTVSPPLSALHYLAFSSEGSLTSLSFLHRILIYFDFVTYAFYQRWHTTFINIWVTCIFICMFWKDKNTLIEHNTWTNSSRIINVLNIPLNSSLIATTLVRETHSYMLMLIRTYASGREVILYKADVCSMPGKVFFTS